MSLTIYRELEQRSEQWYAARAGLVTASAVGKLITHGKPDPAGFECVECSAPTAEPCIGVRGKPIKTMHPARHAAADAAPNVLTVADNDTSRGLITTLAAERITGHVEDGPFTRDMERGVLSEPFARDAYADHYKVDVEEIGFVVRDFPDDAVKIGYSPDGFVGDDGLIEIKAPRAKGHVATILDGQVPAYYMAQCQAGLLVTGRKWLDFISFNGGMHLFVIRVEPDPVWQAAIFHAADHAEREIARIVHEYEAAVKGLPLTDRIPDPFADVELKLA
jgi:hypothetical protein